MRVQYLSKVKRKDITVQNMYTNTIGLRNVKYSKRLQIVRKTGSNSDDDIRRE
jgi:hypothetical protein